jgi:hypothetical protein
MPATMDSVESRPTRCRCSHDAAHERIQQAEVPEPVDEPSRCQLALDAEFLAPMVLAKCDKNSRVWTLFNLLAAQWQMDDYEPDTNLLLTAVRAFYILAPKERERILSGWRATPYIVGDDAGRGGEIEVAEHGRMAHWVIGMGNTDRLSVVQAISVSQGTEQVEVKIVQGTPKAQALAMIRRLADEIDREWDLIVEHPELLQEYPLIGRADDLTGSSSSSASGA